MNDVISPEAPREESAIVDMDQVQLNAYNEDVPEVEAQESQDEVAAVEEAPLFDVEMEDEPV